MVGERGWLIDYQYDECVRRLLDSRSLKESTKLSYLKGIHDICEFYQMEPSELVEMFKKLDEDGIVKAFKKWFIGRKDDLAPKTFWIRLGGVKAFLIENDIDIDRYARKINREFRRVVGRVRPILKRDIITKEEIIKILRIADLRERAIIALLASSGLRIGACFSLRLGDFKDDLWDDRLSCYAIEVREEARNEGEPYITFTTWETGEYLRDYLKMREQNGETLTSSSPLFATKYGTPLNPSRFDNIWRELCLKAGIDMRPVPMPGLHPRAAKGGKIIYVKGAVRYNIHVHSLRKFFKTTLTISGVDRLASEAMMGHSLATFGVESIYDYAVSNLDYLRSEYLKALNNLLFLRKPRGLEIINGQARKRIEELENELKARDQMIEKLSERLMEVEKQLREWQETFNQILKATGGLFMIDEKGRFVARKTMKLEEWDKEVKQKTKKKKRKKP